MNGPRQFGSALQERGSASNSANIVGIASLDSPLLQQTKAEIRTLAAEIAKLAHSHVTPAQFYTGFLSRLSTAMGATGGAIWQCHLAATNQPTEIQLVAHYQFPQPLFVEEQPTETHRAILDCVLAEGQPILVPPSDVKLDASRPTNPINESLIVVPVRVQDSIDYIVEIVQRPTGGPAAQRGYLRFVAQMSDLLSDFLRQDRLRSLSRTHRQTEQIERALCRAASCNSIEKQQQMVIDDLQELLASEHAVLVAHHPNSFQRARVVAIAGTGAFDPRSQLVGKLAQFAFHCFANAPTGKLSVFDARPQGASVSNNEVHTKEQSEVDELCGLLGCQRLLALPLGNQRRFNALFSYASCEVEIAEQLPAERTVVERIGLSLGTLIERTVVVPRWSQWLVADTRPTIDRKSQSLRRIWLPRLIAATALGLLAIIPVPQNIGAVATLKPSHKNFYYSPVPATVESIWVRDGEAVVAGQPLISLESSELNFQVLRLKSERTQQLETISQLKATLGKNNRLSPSDLQELEFKLHNYEQELSAIEAELRLRELEVEKLTVRARSPGIVSTWGLENRLLGRPVVADDMLVATYRPDSEWHFETAIPEQRIGIVNQAISRTGDSISVGLVLSSFPDRVIRGQIRRLDAQTTSLEISAQSDSSERSIQAEVAIDAMALPLKKDGAIARATIECGRVPLAWLVVRDAYCQLSTRIQMLW